MSRIGKVPIKLPDNVSAEVSESNHVTIHGPKGDQSITLMPNISIMIDKDNASLVLSRASDSAADKANHGLNRSLINNMVIGVSQGFSKKLEIVGVGYRVNQVGKNLVFNLGFSHDVNFAIPSDLNATVEGNFVTISGIDKQRVGQIAAEIRSLKKPEPYKGKGIRLEGEYIIRKSGKSGKDK